MNKKSRYFLIIVGATVLAGCFVLAFGSSAIASAIRGLSGEKPEAAPSSEFPRVADALRAQVNPSSSESTNQLGFEQAGDPFKDATGVTGETQSPTTPQTGATIRLNQNSLPGLPTAPAPSNLPIGAMTQQTPNQLPPMPAVPQTTPNRDTEVMEAYGERERAKMLGKSVDSAPIYGFDDLRPAAIAGSPCKPKSKEMCHDGVLISPVTKQNVYIVPGTRLRDGVIVAIGDDGVTFQRDSGEKVKKAWSRKVIENKKTGDGFLNAGQAKKETPVQTARGENPDDRQPL